MSPTLADLYDGDKALTDPVVRRLRISLDAPHPLHEVRYADGVMPDTTAGHIHSHGRRAEQAPGRDWCVECEEPVDILEESDETAGAEECERHYHVIRLACGHEIAQAIR